MSIAGDQFNSVGGYSIGIPPVSVITANSTTGATTLNITTANVTGSANIGGVLISANTINAGLFKGIFEGDVQGNVIVGGLNTQVLFNDTGNIGANAGFTFNPLTQLTEISGKINVGTLGMGIGVNEISSSTVSGATTSSSNPDQVLHTIPSNQVCSMDYTIIATQIDVVDNITPVARQTSKLFATILGTEVSYYEYGSIDLPALTAHSVADFKVRYDSGNIQLTVEPTSSGLTTYKIIIVSYNE